MKSIRNHLSLVVALLSILFSIQVFFIVERSIDAYKVNLSTNYSIIAVSQKKISNEDILKINKLLKDSNELSPDSVIKRLNKDMKSKNRELLKLALPHFYKLSLSHFPSPKELKQVRDSLLGTSGITKVEDFSRNHDATYKLLLLFKSVVLVFSIVVFVVTILLILKELKIWQYKHNERMSIMSLFGAATWLRSAVLFRLAIVDAFIATVVAFCVFTYAASSAWLIDQFKNIGIDILIFNPMIDSLVLLGVAMFISILLATLIVLGHKEEV